MSVTLCVPYGMTAKSLVGTAPRGYAKLRGSLLGNKVMVPKNTIKMFKRFYTDHKSEDLKLPLTIAQQALYQKEVSFLRTFLDTLERVYARKDDLSSIRAAIDQLQDLFLLVVVGEFNSGKSTFLNALLGSKYLKGGPTPTTSKIDILRYGPSVSVEDVSEEIRSIHLPVEWLKEISLVDTPGTNAVFKMHQTLTEHYLPRSDLVLWVTSVDRAFSQSERLFLEQVKELRKKVVVILSKIDIVDESDQVNEVMAFVSQQFQNCLQENPIVFPLSSKEALSAKLACRTNNSQLSENPMWKKSQFGSLQAYILETLNSKERALLKLKNPLGLAEHMTLQYQKEALERNKILKEDLLLLKRIEGELEEHKRDMEQDFQNHIERIQNVLLRLSERSKDFINSKFTITNLIYLLNSEKVQTEFKEKVVGETSAEIEKYVNDLIDWTMKKNSKQWSNMIDYINARTAQVETKMIGKPTTEFDYNRTKLLEALSVPAAKILVSGFDQRKQSEKVINSIKNSLLQTAVGVGIGVTLGSVLATSILDPTGLMAIGTVTLSASVLLPLQRNKLLSELQTNIEDVRSKLVGTLKDHFDEQLIDGMNRMNDNISPYTHWVKNEQKELVAQLDLLKKAQEEVSQLSKEVDGAFQTEL